ncbi:MAG: Zn-dependent alcohol dehydrogenase [Planctomycetes bacterium]|nr:Zn-dependent alcohol dehydrogenase [Planctomycetota bacterium]
MKTRAAVLSEPNTPFRIEELDLEAPRAGEALVKVAACGVCHSDWHLVTGATKHPLPLVAGHEGAGVVEAVGPGVTRVKPGDHVALNWAPNCGTCFYCTHGRPSLCEAYTAPTWAGTMMDGTPRLSRNGKPVYHYCALASFSERAVVPQECCVPLDRRVPFPVAALIGCAVTTGVGGVLNTAQVAAGSSVAVFGAGGVGLSIVMGARLAGAARIVAIDRADAKRTIAKQFGATDALLAGPDVVAQIRALTGGRGADYVFEAIGIPALQEQCVEAARPGGTIVFSGIAPMGSATNIPGAILTRQEKTVMGSYYGTADTARDFPRFAELFLQGKLPLDRLVSRTFKLEEINEAFAEMLKGETARGVIVL